MLLLEYHLLDLVRVFCPIRVNFSVRGPLHGPEIDLWVFGERHKVIPAVKDFEPNVGTDMCTNCALTQSNMPNPAVISQVTVILIFFISSIF